MRGPDDPKADEVARDVLLRFTPDQHRQVEEFAAQHGVTKYDLIRKLVADEDPR